ncbi:MAG: hypothetical protein WCZ47_03745 [Bacilli bacterium]|jgi:tRNA nucleotidyltransferase (CCA-adding enzyme)|nr:CCA tRNA nucleotidyltransferase [Erysipelotrichia bacterium]
MLKKIFLELAAIFDQHGFSLYIVGGTARDYLLGLEVKDYDFVTDATPKQMKSFLVDANYTFERYGTVTYIFKKQKIDLVTLRKESGYGDYRHPQKIAFVKTLKEDYKRRDFTINALYIDMNLNVYDFTSGISDLKQGLIRFIGCPKKRIKEDPLRIVRAERFAKKLNFQIEAKTNKAIKKYYYLLEKINPHKIELEKSKEKA